jgi:3-isopropylmalate/(R)-2-methylmalate dehydratase small subunit
MSPFNSLTGIAAPLAIANIDTDQIVPARYLKGVTRDGLGDGLLAPLRYDEEGRERPEFILNQAPWRKAQILITRENFGCGSSREHAPWALAGFGIRVVIAPSFADIFYNNAIKNGLLPAIVQPAEAERLIELAHDPATAELTVDLEAQEIRTASGETVTFAISADRREALLFGLDEIGRSLEIEAAIAAFEARHLANVSPIPLWPELEPRLG